MNPVCPYCNADIEQADPNRIHCSTCGEAHHGECWQENGVCTVFGCASSPREGPTLIVGASDLVAAPPPPPGFSTSPPPPPPPTPRSMPFMSFGAYNTAIATPPVSVPAYIARPKNRVAYILLGVFFGIFGAHNF